MIGHRRSDRSRIEGLAGLFKRSLLSAACLSSCATMSAATPAPGSDVVAYPPRRCPSCKPQLDVMGLGRPHRVRGSVIADLLTGKNLKLVPGLRQPAVMQIQAFVVDGTWEKTEFQIIPAVERGRWRVAKDRLCVSQPGITEKCARVWAYSSRPDILLVEYPDGISFGRRVLVFEITAKISN